MSGSHLTVQSYPQNLYYKAMKRTPTLQLAWGDIKFLPPDFLTIRWKLHFEELGSKENGTCCYMMGLKLQAERRPQPASRFAVCQKRTEGRDHIKNLKKHRLHIPIINKIPCNLSKSILCNLEFLYCFNKRLIWVMNIEVKTQSGKYKPLPK